MRPGRPAAGGTLYVTLEPCAHAGQRDRSCADAAIEAGVARVVVGRRATPTRRSPAGGSTGCGRPGWPSRWPASARDGTGGDGGGRAAGALPAPPPHRTAASRPQAGRHPRRPHRRPRRLQPVDHRCRGPPRRPPPAGRQRRHPRGRRHRPHRRPRAHRPARPPRSCPTGSSNRCGSCSAGAPPTPGAARPSSCPATSDAVLDELGRRGVLQLLVEGGAAVAHDLHQAGLVDRYVLYLAPLLFGGDDARGLFAGPGAATLADAWRGRLVGVTPPGRRPAGRPGATDPARRGPGRRLPPRAARYRRRRRLTMFTGIVEELGTVAAATAHACASSATHRARRRRPRRLHRGQRVLPHRRGLRRRRRLVGGRRHRRDLRPHHLGELAPGDPVNLERPVRLEDRLGGHLVQGHVDAVGEIVVPAPDLPVRMPDVTCCATSSRRARSPSTASA